MREKWNTSGKSMLRPEGIEKEVNCTYYLQYRQANNARISSESEYLKTG
jgi:hypothetical protein